MIRKKMVNIFSLRTWQYLKCMCILEGGGRVLLKMRAGAKKMLNYAADRKACRAP